MESLQASQINYHSFDNEEHKKGDNKSVVNTGKQFD